MKGHCWTDYDCIRNVYREGKERIDGWLIFILTLGKTGGGRMLTDGGFVG